MAQSTKHNNGDIVYYEWHGVILKGKVITKTVSGDKTIYHVV